MRNILINVIKEINPFDDFDEKTDLIGEGILDSLTLMTYIEQIENRVDVHIPEETIEIENFLNIESIERLLKGLNAG